MIYALHSIFTLLLVLLQLISPLLHAHADADFSPEGIHIPGLKVIADSEQLPAFIYHGPHFDIDEVIFSVASGIKSPADVYASATKPILQTNEIVLACNLMVREINFSPHPDLVITHFFHHATAPRAPPI